MLYIVYVALTLKVLTVKAFIGWKLTDILYIQGAFLQIFDETDTDSVISHFIVFRIILNYSTYLRRIWHLSKGAQLYDSVIGCALLFMPIEN